MEPTGTIEQRLELGSAEAARRLPAGLRTPDAGWIASRVATDALMLAATVVVAEIGASRAGIPTTPAVWLAGFPLLTIFLLRLRGLYRPQVITHVLDELRVVLTATSLAAMSVLALRVLVTNDPWVASQTARMWVFATAYVAAGRAVLSLADRRARLRGEGLRPTLIVGAGKVARVTAKRLLEHPELGLRPVGFLDKEPLEDRASPLPVLGASWDLDRVVAEHGIGQVIVAFSTAPHWVVLRLARRCEELGVRVSFVPRLFERIPGRVAVDHLGGLPLVSARPTDPKSWEFAVKYAADRLIAATLLVLSLPLLAAAALAVWLSVGRPLLFRQPRVGRDGQVFEMLKLRTMEGSSEIDGEADADWAERQLNGEAAPGRATPPHDRRTPVGRFLRLSSIDELPQLWNVFRGEMSIVGPRPERTHYVERFEQNVYRYADRHRVKSGITGWAQVNGLRGETSLADRVEWDNYYIENWSLWLDVKILLLTFLALFRWREVG